MDVVPTQLALAVLLQEVHAQRALVHEAVEHERNCGRSRQTRQRSRRRDRQDGLVRPGRTPPLLREPPPQTRRCNIYSALSSNPFAVDVAHDVFLVTPAVVKDNGGRRLVREDFFVEFLTPAVAAKTFELAENRMDQLQQFISRAFDVSSTRAVAGRLVEGLMHRALSRGIRYPTSGRLRRWRGGCDPRAPRQSRHLCPQRRPHNRASPVPPAAAAELRPRGRDGRDDAQPARPLADLQPPQQGLWHHAQHHCRTAEWGGRQRAGPRRCGLLPCRQ
ncbi:hypothetical protein FB451DRAFT_1251000 [Mycena latifolia]|nr:hypothetical protein FB451DRAFT_1251000 [Mycena latifolia]